MTKSNQLQHLKAIAHLIRERDLSRLRLTSLQKSKIEGLLGALDNTQCAADLNPIAAAQVADRFGLWTTNRRIALNQQLARTMADWLAVKADAQRSFARAEVLDKLTSKY
ncbi:MAG: hypothetical protein ACK4VZ_07980 [Paracoccaceae bacterium]